jgi:hypothetical protein
VAAVHSGPDEFWTTRSLALGVVQDQSSRKPCYENEHNNLKEPHGEKIVAFVAPRFRDQEL